MDIEQGVLPLEEIKHPLYQYEPVSVTCNSDGESIWEPADSEGRHFLIRLLDPDRYPEVMARALLEVLTGKGKGYGAPNWLEG